jgi:hypothetical protein
MTRSRSLAARGVMALLLMAGFYALALGISGALLWVPMPNGPTSDVSISSWRACALARRVLCCGRLCPDSIDSNRRVRSSHRQMRLTCSV